MMMITEKKLRRDRKEFALAQLNGARGLNNLNVL